jgi:hypothetical protein
MSQKELRVTGPKGYLVWLALNQPRLYKQIRPRLLASMPANLSGFGSTNLSLTAMGVSPAIESDPLINAAPSGASSKWADTLQTILGAAATVYTTKTQIDAQKRINDMQLDRLRQGLPPLNIDPGQYGLATASASIGVSEGTRKWLTYGGLAVVGAWILTSLVGGRRRAA